MLLISCKIVLLFLSPSNDQDQGVGRALYAYPIRYTCLLLSPVVSPFPSFLPPVCSLGNGITTFNQDNNRFSLPKLASNFQDSLFPVEFDTNLDSCVGDTNGNHVGIDVNSFTFWPLLSLIPTGLNLVAKGLQ
ncbi:hypothetical protein Nepgr_024136 [Nepenthes gracilis]|uniref:Legume lectin domain-containing protein n=1 Tax=Nepenthes gracilis TaxID=150966 RepID=A0AAD3T275_NEPGR|nr:hypothetical protein Nepgr_024136 [Nepenthes gracilis]